MRAVTINLPDELFQELEMASANVHEMGFGPSQFVQEIVEADLAARRLPRVTPGRLGARVKEEAEPEGYSVLWPGERE